MRLCLYHDSPSHHRGRSHHQEQFHQSSFTRAFSPVRTQIISPKRQSAWQLVLYWCCSVAFVLVPRKPKSPPRQKPSSRAVSPVRDADGKDRSYRSRDGRDAPRERDYRPRRPLSPPRRRMSPVRDSRDYRRRPLSPPRSRRHAFSFALLMHCQSS